MKRGANYPSGQSLAELLLHIVAADVSLERNPQCRVVHAWLRTLSVPAADEAALWRLIQSRVDCLGKLRESLSTDCLNRDGDALLRCWSNGVDCAVAWWQEAESCNPAVPEITGDIDLPHPNAVLCTTIWATLADWSESPPVSRTIREALDYCARSAQGWCERIPVPPGRHHPWDPRQYLHAGPALATLLAALVHELKNWDDLVLEDYADEILRQRNGPVEFSPARFCSVRDAMMSACRELTLGWPIERNRLETALRDMSAAVPSNDSPLGGVFDPLRAAIGLIDSTLAIQKSQPGNKFAGVEVEAPSGPLSDSSRTSLASLANIARWANRADVNLMPTIQAELNCLLGKVDELPLSGEESRIGRDLLSLLIEIDSQLAMAVGSTQDLVSLRDRLRRVLVNCFPYRILEAATLVGRSFEEFRDRIRIRYTQPSGSVGRIIHVARPGYVFDFPDGRTSVIRLAEVDISG